MTNEYFFRCLEEKYNLDIPITVSVVIVYHNEAVSVLIRMINTIFARSPHHILLEIVLLDDQSDEGL